MELGKGYSRMQELDAEMVAISMDKMIGAGAAARWDDNNYPVLYTSKDRTVPEAYGVWDLHNDSLAAPSVFVVDKSGQLRFTWLSESPYEGRVPVEAILGVLEEIETPGA